MSMDATKLKQRIERAERARAARGPRKLAPEVLKAVDDVRRVCDTLPPSAAHADLLCVLWLMTRDAAADDSEWDESIERSHRAQSVPAEYLSQAVDA